MMLQATMATVPRTRADRWQTIRALANSVRALVQSSAHLDSLHARHRAWEYLREADLIDREVDRLIATIERECSLITVELLTADIEKQRKHGRRKH
jgi:hypothetical protein